MKSLMIVQVIRTAGSISLVDLMQAGALMGSPMNQRSLGVLERLVESGVVGRSKGLFFMVVAAKELNAEGLASELVGFFHDKEFTMTQVAKNCGIPREMATKLVDELVAEGKVKHTRDGKYMGRPFPYFKVVKGGG